MKRVYSGLLLSAALSIAACSTNPSTGRDQLLLVSEDEVSQMGVQATPELIQEYGGEIESAQVRQYVNEVGRKLAQQVEPEYKDIQWQFHVLDSDVINAFALPPGRVFVSRGLLEQLPNEAALAAVLGHEMGHITARHVSERISQQMLLEGIAQGASVAVSGSSGAEQLVPLVVGLGGQGYLLKFSRDQESEADHQGLKYMVKSGYSPQGAAQVMRVLIRANQGGKQLEMLSTHPDPEQRLRDIQEAISTEFANTKGNPQYGLFPERYRQKMLAQLR